jgi:hypothetical protein
MQIYQDTASILAAAINHPDPELRHLLTLRIESLGEDLPCLLQVLILQAGDTVADMSKTLGLPCPTPDRPDFCPPWEVIEAYGRWFELTFLRGDDGAGVVVFVPDTADAELLALCARYAIPESLP